ncbi:MAG: PRC-barrel domain-containing protein [Acidimicrobiales bacterium]
MAETTQFTIGAEASCTDGPCGEVIKVVVDPVAQSLTHLVIEPKHRAGLGRLVPLALVDATADEVRLRCTLDEFDQLDMAEDIQFLPGSGYAGYAAGEAMSWPYYNAVGGIGPGNTSPAITHDTLPLGEVAVRRGEPVHAVDGEIGHVQGLVIQPQTHHVTHVLLQEGHIWGRKEVAIPISAVAGIDDGIRLTLTKAEIEDLPPVDLAELPG